MRVGLIGAGAIVRRAHLPGLRAAGADVVAVTAGAGSSAGQIADEHGLVLCADPAELLARSDVDAVVISSPNAFHAAQAAAAIEAGVHVLVEKPLATSLGDARELVEVAEAGAVVAMTAHNARFAPLVVEARRVAQAHEVTSLRLALRGGGPRVWAPASTWFFEPALAGGGVLLDLGVHVLDAARFVLGDELSVVSATVLHVGAVDVEATVRLVSLGGVAVELAVSWMAASPGFELVLQSGSEVLPVLPNMGVPADTVQAAFVRAVTDGGAGEPGFADGAAAVALALDAYEAAR